MSNEECEKVLKELEDVRPEMLNDKAKRLYEANHRIKEKIKAKIEEKFLEAKGLYERGVQPQAQYTMKLLRDLEKSLLEKE